jgi:protein-tyrosine-phosphatase/DNA-binding transcriptional ArsR family regulator
VSITDPPSILGLLGDPVRWQLVNELCRSDRRVGELVARLGKPQNVVSYHLAELRRADLVQGRRSSADGRDVYYRADALRCRELLAAAGSLLAPGAIVGTRAGRARRGRPSRMLFVCTGNSARSQIAQALVEHGSRGAIDVRSAGTRPTSLHPAAVRVMAARGIDIAGRATTPVASVARRRFDRVISLCDRAREELPEFVGPPVFTHWSVPDPAAAEDDGAFAAVADDIEARVDLLLADLNTPNERDIP